MSKAEQIKAKAVEIIKETPSGIRYSQLVSALKKNFPETPTNTINGSIWNLDVTRDKEIYKPDRGLFRHTSFRSNEIIQNVQTQTNAKSICEEDFYQPFADFLKGELGECNKAITLGGSKFKDKWGTPDVVGRNKSNDSDIIKHETEIISAEIKIDDLGNTLITAFGQACAYKSFSHKVYIVVPKTASDEDISRLESLCLIFGIGLILFDSKNKENPNFQIKTRPIKHEPDSFYVNKYIKLIENELFT